jgi:pimeloyl-ACP methyl ester carboxylesterase
LSSLQTISQLEDARLDQVIEKEDNARRQKLEKSKHVSRRYFHLTRFFFAAGLAVIAGCSTSEKSARLSPLVRAERALARAERIRSDPQQKAAEILTVARVAENEIPNATESAGSGSEDALGIYNRAAADLASELPELTRTSRSSGFLTIQNRRTGESYRLKTMPADRREYSPEDFQELLNTGKLRVRRGEEAVVRPGVGGTLVGVQRSNPPGTEPPRLQPAKGYRVPVTSIIEFGPGEGSTTKDARLLLINPRRQDTVELGGESFPLAANFSAPLVSFGRLNELWLGFVNMIRGQNMQTSSGLLLIEPYDPDRLPVIFVHGLLSSPFIWRQNSLALLQDPVIRQHYQFWAFSYPTGNPISISALRLREDIAFAQKRFGLTHGIVLIGHSMGGLLSRMQVTNSGRTIWDEVFGAKAQQLYAEVPDTARPKRALIFQANPAIQRVIFIATPHRGSSLATGGIGVLAIRLIRLPLDVVNVLAEVPETIANVLEPKSGRRRTIIPTSIHGLSPNSPLLHALDRLPIEAPHHSIIGDRGRGDTPNSSDGVVPYWSSHLDSAQSEKIVPSGHEAMADPQAIAEIRRILLLNLRVHENALGVRRSSGALRPPGAPQERRTPRRAERLSARTVSANTKIPPIRDRSAVL